MKLGLLIGLEVILFWTLLYTGAILENLVTRIAGDPEDTSVSMDVVIVCLQIVLMTFISINLRPFVLKNIVQTTLPQVHGAGLLYGFALLLPQYKFKDRIKTITKL